MKEYWLKTRLRPFADAAQQQQPCDNEHAKRRGDPSKDVERDRHHYRKQQSDYRQGPEPNKRAPQDTSVQSDSFYIDPITNRKVMLGGWDQSNKLDATGPFQRSGEYQPTSETLGQDGYIDKEMPPSQTEGSQPITRFNDLPKDQSTVDAPSDLRAKEQLSGQSSRDLGGAQVKAQLHFKDLNPPSADVQQFQNISFDKHENSDSQAQSRTERDDVTSAQEHTGDRDKAVTESQVSNAANTLAQQSPASAVNIPEHHLHQPFSSDSSQAKPAGYVEASVAPESLHEYPCIVEQTSSGDFPRPTFDDLRRKYGHSQIKKYTAVRCQETNAQPCTVTEPNLTRHGWPAEHERVITNEHGHEQSLSGFSTKTPGHIGDESNCELWEKSYGRRIDESRAKYQTWLASMKQLEAAKKQDEILSDAADREAAMAVRQKKARVDAASASETKMTGNYVRNFPEEFETSWTQTLASTPTAPFHSHDIQMSPGEGQSMEGGLEGAFGQPEPTVIQPSLDRSNAPTAAQRSREAQEMAAEVINQSRREMEENIRAMAETAEELEKLDKETDLSRPSRHGSVASDHIRITHGYKGDEQAKREALLQKALAAKSNTQAALERAKEAVERAQALVFASTPEPQRVNRPDGHKLGETSVKTLAAKDGVDGQGDTNKPPSGTPPEDSTIVRESSASPSTNNTLYKILAYDPASQTISLSDTSSLETDFTSAHSPAAALSRLAHPSAFVPHVERLVAEGFEIVSGSGDVLIFRQAHALTAELGSTTAEAKDTPSPAEAASAPINPIDMTGRPRFMTPASANFASPTGYVAYPETDATEDLPPPPPRVKYNIHLRREEPVYSGPKICASEAKRKAGLGKRILVGGVWLAGISYGLGVVSEYFTTGGVDGMGPSGF